MKNSTLKLSGRFILTLYKYTFDGRRFYLMLQRIIKQYNRRNSINHIFSIFLLLYIAHLERQQRTGLVEKSKQDHAAAFPEPVQYSRSEKKRKTSTKKTTTQF